MKERRGLKLVLFIIALIVISVFLSRCQLPIEHEVSVNFDGEYYVFFINYDGAIQHIYITWGEHYTVWNLEEKADSLGSELGEFSVSAYKVLDSDPEANLYPDGLLVLQLYQTDGTKLATENAPVGTSFAEIIYSF